MGVVPWLGIKGALQFARECGFDGVELLPTRRVTKELTTNLNSYKNDFQNIENAHQSWRLDIGHDDNYGIDFASSLFYTALRLIFFPKKEKSKGILSIVSDRFNTTVTVHTVSDEWTKDSNNHEFKGGINFEILEDRKVTRSELEKWLKDKKHGIVVDTRDDQSLRWATQHGFSGFLDFWAWLGLEKIKNIQLTLIGKDGIKKIFDHRASLAEEEMLWLYKKEWEGSVTVEVNPFTLFLVTLGNMKKGLQKIVLFIVSVLDKGEKWSKD